MERSFPRPSAVAVTNLQVFGAAGPIPVTGFAYQTTRSAVWTLGGPLVTRDRLRLVLDDALVPGLDGEWADGADTYPSGNGRPGGDFSFTVNVLAGDATGDGAVNALDLADVKRRLGRRPGDGITGAGGYSVFADLTADGVVDLGQLAVLISSSLRDPLSRIGVTEVADDETLAVMRGDGPQQGEGTYSCGFHCYPIQATDPATGMARDDVHMWSAPGGTGTHSLPPDFLPGTLAPVDGARVLLVVGPKSPGMRFVRVIPAVRAAQRSQPLAA